jgi:uncharacterized 2Fe-2S/4Fe-4S cluster protein (DUF4445 family)
MSAAEEIDEGAAGSAPARVRLRFSPSDIEVKVPGGVTVFDAASWNGIAIDSTCGGHGTCKKCRVRITAGEAPVSKLDSRAFTPDELRDGWRLACRIQTQADLDVDVPPLVTRPKAATVGVGRQVILRPSVVKRHLVLEEPTLSDQRTDIQRVLDAMDDLEVRAPIGVLRTLGKTLRDAKWDVTAVVADDELIAVEAGDTTARRFALAIDLGTTTVVANLLDLDTGTPVAVRSMLNKQQPFGADVISRISATMMDPDALAKLQELAHETLAELADEVTTAGGVAPEEVYEVVLAGNATMTQIALGIDPEPVGAAPFVMTSTGYDGLRATDLGIAIHPNAPATVFPSLGAYVGGDITAGILASGLDRDRRLRLFIDVGTNCEIALGNQDRIVATAAPAGPAFEAASIQCGMRAAPGAIEIVTITDDDVELGVIDDAEPIGMCGSGLVDAVAELVRTGLLDASGKLITDAEAADHPEAMRERLVTIGDQRAFVLHWTGTPGDTDHAVYLSQRDVRELQFAKAAIATGWALLLEELDIDPSEVQQVLLAGSFGSYLSAKSAIRIGLVPKLPIPRIISAGNVAGEGAKMAVLSRQERHAGHALINAIEYVELSDRADFNDRFVEQLAFPQ